MTRAVLEKTVAAVVVVIAVVSGSACSAILGDASYRCASGDDGACPTTMVCELRTGTCVAPDAATDASSGDDDDDDDDDGSVQAPVDASLDAPGANDAAADAPARDASPDAASDAHSASEAATFLTPPVCDGVIGFGEYGSTVESTNVVHTTTGQAWYATWDDTNLYLAVSGVALGDGVVVYLSSLASGSTEGFDNYDQVTIDPLPFPAQLTLYAKAGSTAAEYSEYRTFSGGSWSSATAGTPTVCGTDTNTNAREIVLPWGALGVGGRPASFHFFAFAAQSDDSGPFAEVPTTDPAADTGSWSHAFAVADSDPGGSAPFAAQY